MTVAATVEQYLKKHSVDYDLTAHAPTGSSHEVAEASHVREDHVAKAVIVKDSNGFVMIVIPASNWLDMDHLRKELNRDLHLVTEEELETLFTDCETGAVPPLGPAYGIETLLDESVKSLANVYFEAGDHETLVHVSGDNFKILLAGARHGYFSKEN